MVDPFVFVLAEEENGTHWLKLQGGLRSGFPEMLKVAIETLRGWLKDRGFEIVISDEEGEIFRVRFPVTRSWVDGVLREKRVGFEDDRFEVDGKDVTWSRSRGLQPEDLGPAGTLGVSLADARLVFHATGDPEASARVEVDGGPPPPDGVEVKLVISLGGREWSESCKLAGGCCSAVLPGFPRQGPDRLEVRVEGLSRRPVDEQSSVALVAKGTAAVNPALSGCVWADDAGGEVKEEVESLARLAKVRVAAAAYRAKTLKLTLREGDRQVAEVEATLDAGGGPPGALYTVKIDVSKTPLPVPAHLNLTLPGRGEQVELGSLWVRPRCLRARVDRNDRGNPELKLVDPLRADLEGAPRVLGSTAAMDRQRLREPIPLAREQQQPVVSLDTGDGWSPAVDDRDFEPIYLADPRQFLVDLKAAQQSLGIDLADGKGRPVSGGSATLSWPGGAVHGLVGQVLQVGGAGREEHPGSLWDALRAGRAVLIHVEGSEQVDRRGMVWVDPDLLCCGDGLEPCEDLPLGEPRVMYIRGFLLKVELRRVAAVSRDEPARHWLAVVGHRPSVTGGLGVEAGAFLPARVAAGADVAEVWDPPHLLGLEATPPGSRLLENRGKVPAGTELVYLCGEAGAPEWSWWPRDGEDPVALAWNRVVLAAGEGAGPTTLELHGWLLEGEHLELPAQGPFPVVRLRLEPATDMRLRLVDGEWTPDGRTVAGLAEAVSGVIREGHGSQFELVYGGRVYTVRVRLGRDGNRVATVSPSEGRGADSPAVRLYTLPSARAGGAGK